MAENLRANYENRVATESTGLRKILAIQKRIGHPDGLPVHLKGKNDIKAYRGIMGFTLIGLAMAFGGIYMMATDTLPRKER